MGTACYVKGANDILGKFLERLSIEVGECTSDGKFSLDSCRCIGACGLAPVVTINDEVYGRLTPEQAVSYTHLMAAPRTKSTWPPTPENWLYPMVSEATWP